MMENLGEKKENFGGENFEKGGGTTEARRHGGFQRTIQLPRGVMEDIKASELNLYMVAFLHGVICAGDQEVENLPGPARIKFAADCLFAEGSEDFRRQAFEAIRMARNASLEQRVPTTGEGAGPTQGAVTTEARRDGGTSSGEGPHLRYRVEGPLGREIEEVLMDVVLRHEGIASAAENLKLELDERIYSFYVGDNHVRIFNEIEGESIAVVEVRTNG